MPTKKEDWYRLHSTSHTRCILNWTNQNLLDQLLFLAPGYKSMQRHSCALGTSPVASLSGVRVQPDANPCAQCKPLRSGAGGRQSVLPLLAEKCSSETPEIALNIRKFSICGRTTGGSHQQGNSKCVCFGRFPSLATCCLCTPASLSRLIA